MLLPYILYFCVTTMNYYFDVTGLSFTHWTEWKTVFYSRFMVYRYMSLFYYY